MTRPCFNGVRSSSRRHRRRRACWRADRAAPPSQQRRFQSCSSMPWAAWHAGSSSLNRHEASSASRSFAAFRALPALKRNWPYIVQPQGSRAPSQTCWKVLLTHGSPGSSLGRPAAALVHPDAPPRRQGRGEGERQNRPSQSAANFLAIASLRRSTVIAGRIRTNLKTGRASSELSGACLPFFLPAGRERRATSSNKGCARAAALEEARLHGDAVYRSLSVDANLC